MYIPELDDWPGFHWSAETMAAPLVSVRARQCRLMDVTPWMEWFLGCLGSAIGGVQETMSGVLDKKRFWDRIKDGPVNERQRLVINRLLDGFESILTSSKYAVLAKSSQDTALRDILALVAQGVFVRNPEGGRGTSYSLAGLRQPALVIATEGRDPFRGRGAWRLAHSGSFKPDWLASARLCYSVRV